MEHPVTTSLRIGDWRVDPAIGQISLNGQTARLEVRAMRLLLCLAERAGEVVSIDELVDKVWAGTAVSPDSVYQAVASLRRLLGDDPKQPAYIATVPRLGYRMVAEVAPWAEQVGKEESTSVPVAKDVPKLKPSRKIPFAITAFLAFCLVVVAVFLMHSRSRLSASSEPQPQRSVAVLPFLDLTAGMTQEEFADGMTEELIDKLGKIPGLLVPSPTSSFYYKGKQVPVAEIAKKLGVIYVLDGSVRKSGSQVRIAARLVLAENGYVIWTETYDRPFKDVLTIQDDIASQVTKALKSSIEAEPRK